jgi:hypothetical protein
MLYGHGQVCRLDPACSIRTGRSPPDPARLFGPSSAPVSGCGALHRSSSYARALTRVPSACCCIAAGSLGEHSRFVPTPAMSRDVVHPAMVPHLRRTNPCRRRGVHVRHQPRAGEPLTLALARCFHPGPNRACFVAKTGPRAHPCGHPTAFRIAPGAPRRECRPTGGRPGPAVRLVAADHHIATSALFDRVTIVAAGAGIHGADKQSVDKRPMAIRFSSLVLLGD